MHNFLKATGIKSVVFYIKYSRINMPQSNFKLGNNYLVTTYKEFKNSANLFNRTVWVWSDLTDISSNNWLVHWGPLTRKQVFKKIQIIPCMKCVKSTKLLLL